MRGLDYSNGRPPGAAVKTGGYGFVARYLAYYGSRPKYITRGEADDMLGHGVAIVLVYESTQGRALLGREAGAADARTASVSAKAVGQPPTRPIYFTVDQDVTTAAQMARVDDYLRGAASVIGPGRVGVYGEHDVVEHCAATDTARWFWQTKAWSHGRVSGRAHMVQELGTVTVATIECDVNTAKQHDFGQWPGGDEDDVALTDAEYDEIQRRVRLELDRAPTSGATFHDGMVALVRAEGISGAAPAARDAADAGKQIAGLVATVAALAGKVAGLETALGQAAAGGAPALEVIRQAAHDGTEDALRESAQAYITQTG